MKTRVLISILILILTVSIATCCCATPKKYYRAVDKGELREVNRLIEEGAIVNAKDRDSRH